MEFCFFGTNIGFLEFFIGYGNSPADEIPDFAYKFKKGIPDRKLYPKKNGEMYLLEAAEHLLPKELKDGIFFACNADFKRECNCFHMVKLSEPADDIYVEKQIRLLARSYHRGFLSYDSKYDSCFDMVFRPYSHDSRAGCQQGIVNLVYETGNEKKDRFLNSYKYRQLRTDHLFMYLLLLNQRYSAILILVLTVVGFCFLKMRRKK